MRATRAVVAALAWTVHAFALAMVRPAAAGLTPLLPTDDAYVRGGAYANDNFDADGRLRVKNASGADNDRDTLLRFDLAGLHGTVVSATLRLYCKDLPNGAPSSVSVHAVAADSWREDAVTWNTAPAPGALLAARTDIANVGQTYAFDVTPFVAQELSGDRVVTFRLRDDAEVRKAADFDRREDTHPPTLVVATGDHYTLSVSAVGAGYVTLSPPDGIYAAGSVVTLRAFSDPGWQLETWGGAVHTADNPIAVVMDADKSVWVSFKRIPHHALELLVNGLGTVTLEPPGGTYEEGTPVVLAATPAPGWEFDGWSGDLGGAANPDTVVMAAPRSVIATFRSGPAVPSPIVLEETASGDASGASSVSTGGSMSGVDGDLYLAAIATNPFRSVSRVSGLGLEWSRVREQCAGRDETGVSLWMAQGDGAVSGRLDVLLTDSTGNAVVSLCRYSGVDRSQPLGQVVSGNSNGSNGACSGGTKSAAYSLDVPDPAAVGLLLGVAAHAGSVHTPGKAWVERTDVHQGESGTAAALAIVDRVVDASSGAAVLEGSFDAVVDWATLAVLLRPAYGNALALTTAGLGTVTLSPPGGDYPAGSVVSLQAVASPGWYFVGWAGDLGGATNPMSVLMTRTVRVAATFSSVPQYDLGIEVAGGGRVRTSPSARRFAASSTVSLAAEAHPGWTFTGWEGDASGSIPLATVWMQGDRHLRARFEHVGAPVAGLWSSAAELATAPLQGEAWDQVWTAANRVFFPPNVADQNNANNVDCLAAAIVFARTADRLYRDRVVQALDYLADLGNPGANTLAWARELGAYVLAADLVGYRTPAFEAWLLDMAEKYKGSDGRRLLEAFEERPNNWGMQAFGALVAVYAYLHDEEKLLAIRAHWVQGVEGTPPQAKFGELSWHFDPAHPRIVNPARASLHGLDVDGVIADDIRRGGSLAIPPLHTDYAWGALQGIVMAARILERYDPQLGIWSSGEEAIRRAASLMQERWQQQFGGWAAAGDDRWLLPFLDRAYGTHWSMGATAELQAGKNAGWAYVLLASAETPSAVASANGLSYRLYPNFPNPFPRRTNIRFSVPVAGPVRVVVYDVLGRRVATLLDAPCPPGLHDLHWDGVDAGGKPVARGIYWCRLQAGAHRESVRLTLLH